MTSDTRDLPPAVYQLADHLDAALAAGEDLIAAFGSWPHGPIRWRGTNAEAIAARRFAERATIEAVRSAEMRVIARVIKARERAGELGRFGTPFGPLLRLFTAGTAVLADAVPACGDATREDFATADGLIAYLRRRGVIDPDVASFADDEPIATADAFLVAGLAPLAALMDTVALLLDSLDAHYDLYAVHDQDREDQGPPGASAGAEAA